MYLVALESRMSSKIMLLSASKTLKMQASKSGCSLATWDTQLKRLATIAAFCHEMRVYAVYLSYKALIQINFKMTFTQ